jgi:hypothetical protein
MPLTVTPLTVLPGLVPGIHRGTAAAIIPGTATGSGAPWEPTKRQFVGAG